MRENSFLLGKMADSVHTCLPNTPFSTTYCPLDTFENAQLGKSQTRFTMIYCTVGVLSSDRSVFSCVRKWHADHFWSWIMSRSIPKNGFLAIYFQVSLWMWNIYIIKNPWITNWWLSLLRRLRFHFCLTSDTSLQEVHCCRKGYRQEKENKQSP